MQLHISVQASVKNGFSNPTKVQEGQDWPRKDVVNRHRKKALREGCRVRKEARAVVFKREDEQQIRLSESDH